MLLQVGVDKHAMTADQGYTALHFAAMERHQDVVDQLLQAGADKEAVDNNGFTAFDLAPLSLHQNLVLQTVSTFQGA